LLYRDGSVYFGSHLANPIPNVLEAPNVRPGGFPPIGLSLEFQQGFIQEILDRIIEVEVAIQSQIEELFAPLIECLFRPFAH
jgi:hypothetical protein